MDLDDLRLLTEVARLGSFASVARARNCDPSIVSRGVAQIENALGLRIFQRTTRRLALTAAGETYLQRIEGIIEELDRARDDAIAQHAAPSGTVRLTASVAYAQVRIVPLLARFRAQFPDLGVELVMSDANLDLIAERIDLAVRLAPRIDADVVCSKLHATRYRVCASPHYMRAATELKRPDDLVHHDLLLFALPRYRSSWRFRNRSGTVSEVAVRGRITASNAVALRDCARAGLGCALLSDWLIDEDLAEGDLVDVFPHYEVTATAFETAAWMIYPSRRFLPNKVRVTIDFLRQHLT